MAEPAPQPSFRQRLIDIAHPLRKPGGWALPHILLLAVILVVVAFLAGWFVSNRLSQHEVQAKYGHSLRVFKIPPPQPPSKIPQLVSVPIAAHITLARYPGVGDQGSVGSCAAWAAAWAASYEYRLQHPKSSLRFSPRWMYDWFSQGNGDNGSYVGADLSVFPTRGVPRNLQFRYPPWSVDWPVPSVDNYGHDLNADAARYRMPVQVLNAGVGYAGVQFAKSEIAQGHPAMLAIPVYDSFERSTGTVDVPGPNETLYGGHEIVGIQYDDNYRFPSGAIGGIRIQNQWTTAWADHGDAWLSYQFLAEYGYAFNGIRLGGTPVSGPIAPPLFPPHPTHAPPSVPKNVKVPKTLTATLWMRSGPYHRMINHAAAVNHLAPLGLSALVGTESNFQAGATRCVSYADCSAGLTQVTVPTARGYGITGTTAEILAWERHPQNSLNLAGRMLADFRRICGWDWQRLYECWNEGPYRGHAAYLFPTPGYGVQAWQNYQNWTVYVYATYSRKGTP